MNLLLSKRGDYVVRSALCLARAHDDGEQRKIREIVAEMGVPQNYASQILSDLVKAGIATSRAGRDGGYMLAREPASITLLQVVEAGEGPLAPQQCTLGDGPCRWDDVCPLHEAWSSATSALRDHLARTSLAELSKRDRARESGTGWSPTESHRQVKTSLKVEDWVHVERDAVALADRLQHDGWMGDLIGEAYREVDGLRDTIDSSSLPWEDAAPAAVRLSAPTPCPDGATKYQLAWDIPLQGGAESRLDGNIELRPLDTQRTELHLVGRFRPPGHSGQRSAPDDLADRLSRATVRAFLRRVAKAVE